MKTKCMSCGGKVKKAKMGTTVGKATPKGQIYGIPQTGPTGPNYQGVNTMQKGGMVKKQDGGPTPRKTKTVVTSPSGNYKTITKTKNNPDKGSSSSSSKVRLTVKGFYDSSAPGVKTAIKNRKALAPMMDMPADVNPEYKKAMTDMYTRKTGDFKKGGTVKKKLAALAPPTNKVTRADVIAGALKNKRKKK